MCWLVGLLIGWLVDLLDGWLVGWLVGWWLVCQFVGRSVGRLVGRLVGLLIGWLVGLLACWLVGWFLAWLVGWLIGWLVGWLVGYIQIEGIYRPHRHTSRQEKCRKRPIDQRNTLDQHTIHQSTPRSQLYLNRHHNPNQMKKPIKYNTTQNTPDPSCTNTPHPSPPQNQLYPSDQQDTNNN